MSCLILHNGNSLVKPWAVDVYGHTPMPTIADEWSKGDSFFDRTEYAKKHMICTDLSVASQIDKVDLAIVKNSFKFIKVITSYENDTAALDLEWCSELQRWINDYHNIKDSTWPACKTAADVIHLPEHIKKECEEVFGLEPIYNKDSSKITSVTYNKSFWKESLFYGLALTDETIFWDAVSFPSNQCLPKIVFTPGRCGTHILKDIAGVDKHLHHDQNVLQDPERLGLLVNSKKILAVLRRQLIDQVVSDAIGQRYGMMVTDSNNYQKNQTSVYGWNTIEITEQDIRSTFKKIINYADILMGFHLFYNKKIQFSIMEDISKIHGGKIKHKKNPYHHSEMVDNYDQIVDRCEKRYQPIYDKIISRLSSMFGTYLYIR